MAEGLLAPRRRRHRDDLRALLQHDLRVGGQQADELLAVWVLEVGAQQRALADEVGLGLADGPAEAGLVRRQRAVRVLADDDVALLRAQHVHGLGAVGAAAVPHRLGMNGLPHGAPDSRPAR